jgi:hypothetical protein
MRKIILYAMIFISAGSTVVFAFSMNKGGASKPTGADKVSTVKDENGHWQLIVDGEPYLVKGMEYSADTVGSRPELNEWMKSDLNHNGLNDGPYDSWVDKNGDGYQDLDEKTIGDFQLLKEMGCNTIRLYHSSELDKKLLRDLSENYGIRVIMGNLVGAYCVDSGAQWDCGTDYTDPKQRACMKDSVREMVLANKNEQYVLMWMLGNENDCGGSQENSTLNNTNAAGNPEAYAKFMEEMASFIKQLDPNHPVGVCNGTYRMLKALNKYAPDVDVFGINAYLGPYGFGTLWNRVKTEFDRPVLVTEYGADSYNQNTRQIDEDFQALYHKKAWQDIEANTYLGDKTGNSIGGVAYCWMDKWWLCGSSKEHDTENGAWKGYTNDSWVNDEWLGFCGQGNGSKSPFLRRLRKVYFLYRDELWGNEESAVSGAEDQKFTKDVR